MFRRIVQFSSLILLNLNPLLGRVNEVCLPVLNCHSCPYAVMSCPVGIIGHFLTWGVVPLIAVATVAIFGTIFGRFLCGWICPFGLLQDFLAKIPSPKWNIPRWMTIIKYVVLVVMVILVPYFFGIYNLGFFCNVCPAGASESLLVRRISEGDYTDLAASWLKLTILAGVLVFAVVSLRSLCKVFCPIGAILALFNKFSMFSLHYSETDCPSCRACLKRCPMDVRVTDLRWNERKDNIAVPSECILCLECTKSCPQGGLKFSLWNLWPIRWKRTGESEHREIGDEETGSR